MTTRLLPVEVLLLTLGACARTEPSQPAPNPQQVRLYAGGEKTCVVIDDTRLRCWGRNTNGWLGFGSSEPHFGDDEPASGAPSLDVDETITLVSAQTALGCLLLESHKARCWGGGVALGFVWDGWLGDDETLVDGPELSFGADRPVQIAVGSSHACVVFDAGGVKCWGDGEYGATGYAATDDLGDVFGEQLADLPMVDVGGPVSALAAGNHYTCAVMQDGALRCWGSNAFGKLGLGVGLDESAQPIHIGDDEPPSSVEPISLAGGPVIQVAAQSRQVCALHKEGTVSCWGESGPWLGYGKAIDTVGIAYGDDERPSQLGVVDVGDEVVQVVVGDAFSCARLKDGHVKCWGASEGGQLGYGNTNFVGYHETPAEVGTIDLGGRAIELAAGWSHICALLENLELRCWGRGEFGVLGYGNQEHVGDDETPAQAGPVSYR